MARQSDPTWKPSYRLHKSSGQAIVSLRGKDHYLGKFNTPESLSAYDRLVGEWMSSGRVEPAALLTSALLLVELKARYIEYAAAYYAPRDKASSNGELDGITSALAMTTPYDLQAANAFGPLALRAVRDAMVGRGWSRGYVNKQVKRLRRMFNWGLSHQLVDANTITALASVEPLRKGKTTAPERPKVKPVPDAHVEQVLPHCGPTLADMIQLQLLSGMRPTELCKLKASHIDTSGSKVWIARPPEHKGATREDGDDEREIYLGPKCIEIIRRNLKPDTEAFLFSPADNLAEHYRRRNEARTTKEGQGNAPGTNRRAKPKKLPGAHYTYGSYRQAIERACDRAFPIPDTLARQNVGQGDKRRLESLAAWQERLSPAQREAVKAWRKAHRFHPYQLRHSYGTKIRRHFGLEGAQVGLGHKNADTSQIYAEVNRAQGLKIAGKHG